MHDRLDGGDQSGHIPRQADRISRRACWHTWAKLAFSLAPELQHEHSERVWQHTLVRAWRAGVVSDSEMLRICKWASPEVWRFGMRIILGEHGPVRARQDPLPRQLRVLLKARPLDSTQIENIWYLRDMAQGGPRRPRDPSAERRWAVLLKMAPVWCERLQTAIATWNLIHGNDGAVVDILPALLSRRERPWAIGPLLGGDSYGVFQAIHLEESLRWVPASSEMHALPLRAWHG